MKIRQLLVEKYRPTTLDTYVFQNKETEALVRKWVNEGEYPNVMLSGGAGVGKSSLSRILSSLEGIDSGDVKRINASVTNGVDFIRNELTPWLKRAAFGKFKVVVMEEFDRFSGAAQDALRDICEVYSDDVRFIGTCNHPKRISEALQSRFEAGRIHLTDINTDGIIGLCLDIIEAEGITVDEPEYFMSHIDAYAPDIRKILNSMDKHTVNGELTPISGSGSVHSGDLSAWQDFWEMEHSDEWEWKTALELTEGIDAGNADDYFTIMYNNLHHFNNVGLAITRLAEYVYRIHVVANHRLLLEACMYQIFEIDNE